MATFQLTLSRKPDKVSGKSEILVRFFHGSFDQRAKTNIFCNPKYWDASKQTVTIPRARIMTEEVKEMISDLSETKAKIESLKDYVSQSFMAIGAGKVKVGPHWLKDLIHDYNFPKTEETKVSFFDEFEHFLRTRARDLSEVRQRNYRVVGRAFKRFAIYRGLDEYSLLEETSDDTIADFVQYLRDEHTFFTLETDKKGNQVVRYLDPSFKVAYEQVPESRLPKPRGQNSINGTLTKLRAFFNWACDKEITTNNPFKKYRIPQCVYGTPYYITLEERDQLWYFDFSKKPELGRQRDIFIFQCVVGCRVSDLSHLTKSNVIGDAIEYIPRKTKERNPVTIRVPLNSIARKIVQRYKDLPGDRLLPCISDQKYNSDIKKIFKIAGLDRKVTVLNPTTREEEQKPLYEVASSHMARRCFIGNLYKKVEVKDPNLIGVLSGHAEGSRAFVRYRDIDEEIKRDLVAMLE